MLMIRGDMARLELKGGSEVRLPKDFGLVHDPTGEILDRCEVYLCRYRLNHKPIRDIPKRIHEEAREYFGPRVRLERAVVEIPKGPWQRVGVVETIWYTRYGDKTDWKGEPLEGPWYHPYEDRAELFESSCERAYVIRLPDGCIINDRGFVKP